MAAPLLLADWGTSNRRAWLIGSDGEVLRSIADEHGATRIAAGGWPDAYAALERALGMAKPRLALLAGMAGSNRGWAETAYLACPAGLGDLAARLHWVVPGEVAIVPGLRLPGPDADVMRGEEVQALGAAAAGLIPETAFACHPGTHTKWVRIESGRVVAFRTVMTGELFAMLRAHSILGDLLQDVAEGGAAFRAGVDHALTHDDLTAELFRVRARALLGESRSNGSASYVSGLLIGADLRVGLDRDPGAEIHVVGSGDLAALFRAALEHRGQRAKQVDGAAAIRAGLMRIAEQIQ